MNPKSARNRQMRAKHVYLPRLQNKTVLLKCIEQGVNECKFGYAKRHDNDKFMVRGHWNQS